VPSSAASGVREPAAQRGAAQIAAALRELGAAIREHRTPEAVELPDAGALATVADDLRTARTLVAGPGGR
jgi:hypothetical protein